MSALCNVGLEMGILAYDAFEAIHEEGHGKSGFVTNISVCDTFFMHQGRYLSVLRYYHLSLTCAG